MLRLMSAPEVDIVGGGVIGCAIAHALASSGIRVRVLERDRPGVHASAAAAGMFAPLAESEGQGALLPFGLAALRAFPGVRDELRSTTGIDVGWVQRGLVRLFRKDVREASSPMPVPALEALGLEFWDASQLRAQLPGVSPEIECARFSPREGVVDPVRLTRAYRVAAERSGARFESGVRVHSVLETHGRVSRLATSAGTLASECVVWCTGAWAGELDTPLGPLAVRPVKGQMLELEVQTLRSGPLIWGDGVYLVPRDDGLVRVGATMEQAGFDVVPRVGGMLELMRAAISIWPTLEEARFERAWAGLRPVTPDGLPLIGPCPGLSGLVLAVGHGRHGILLSALTAERVRALILGSAEDPPDDDLPWRRLDPGRFASA